METTDVLGAAAADASVRAATAADLGAVGAVHSRAWAAAYRDVLPADVLAAMTPGAMTAAWTPSVTRPPSARHRVLVACAGSTVVGFGACDPDGEVVALLVDPAHQRRGHGSRLLSALVDHLRAIDSPSVSTWCPADDVPRREFLGSAGLAPDGAARVLEVPGLDAGLREVRLVASLAEP